MIWSELWKAVSYLIFTVIIFHIYRTSLESEYSWKELFIKGLFFCVIGAGILTALLGRPTCLSRDQDGTNAPCEEYADDGYEPTDEQYASKFLFYFIIGYAPVALAANHRREADSI